MASGCHYARWSLPIYDSIAAAIQSVSGSNSIADRGNQKVYARRTVVIANVPQSRSKRRECNTFVLQLLLYATQDSVGQFEFLQWVQIQSNFKCVAISWRCVPIAY